MFLDIMSSPEDTDLPGDIHPSEDITFLEGGRDALGKEETIVPTLGES